MLDFHLPKRLVLLQVKSSFHSDFCPYFFGHVGKWLDKKAKANFKIYDVTNCETRNCNVHIAKNSRSKGNHPMKFGQLMEI